MARDPLEKETDVFNQMNQTVALNNQIMKDQVASLKSKKKSAPAKAVVKKKPVDPKFGKFVPKKSAGPMPKVVQKKAPAAPGGSSPYKGNAAPGGSTRTVYKGVAAPGASMRPKAAVPGGSTRPRYSGTPTPGTSSPYQSTSAAKPAAKPAAKTYTPDPSSFASSGVGRMLNLGNPNRKTGVPAPQGNYRGSGKAPAFNRTPETKLGYYSVRTQPKATARTTAGISGKSGKSVNQLFK